MLKSSWSFKLFFTYPYIEESVGFIELQILNNKVYSISFLFKPYDQYFGFDERTPDLPAFDPMYEEAYVHGKPYDVAWKSVSSNQVDLVDAFITIGDTASTYDDIKFRTVSGWVMANNTDEDSIKQLVIQGQAHGSVQQLEAIYETRDTTGKTKEVLAGRLNVISYDDQPINLCLVSVNGNEYPHDLNKLQTDLNRD